MNSKVIASMVPELMKYAGKRLQPPYWTQSDYMKDIWSNAKLRDGVTPNGRLKPWK